MDEKTAVLFVSPMPSDGYEPAGGISMANGKDGESWGGWGPNQVAQPDAEKPLLDVVEGAEAAPPGEHGKAPRVNELPEELANAASGDFRAEEDDADEARMATEPPRARR